MKVRHSFSSSPCKVWENFFRKQALHEGTNFFRQIFGGMFCMENYQIMQGGKLMVKSFQRSSQFKFPLIDPVLFEKLTPQIADLI